MTLIDNTRGSVNMTIPIFEAFILGLVIGLLGTPDVVFAHDTWVLTHEQVAEAELQPAPTIFTTVTVVNSAITLIAALFVLGWVVIGRTGAREMFPDLQLRLASHGNLAALALRLGLAVMLITAAFGLHPRVGMDYFVAPVLFAADLELQHLEGDWNWLVWFQVVLAIGFAFGIYVRATAVVFLGTLLFGFYLFPLDMWSYVGVLGGTGIYLLMRGGGGYQVPLPTLGGAKPVIQWLEDQPAERAQLILRLLTGLNFLYLGVVFKFLHPTFMLAGIDIYGLPTFGFEPETFVFIIATVETVVGVLIIAGSLIRPMTVVLVLALTFFTITMNEGILGHSFLYSVVVVFLLSGAGRWGRPVATDKPSRIVILGATFAGIHGAMRLERLLGPYTKVKLTLVNEENYFQFWPLVPEVIGGSIQPGNVVNPIRRICPRTEYIRGRVTTIDTARRTIGVVRSDGDTHEVAFDQLVVAMEMNPKFSRVPGLQEYAYPVATVADALFLRDRILSQLERVETIADPGSRRQELCFIVVGGGQRGCAIAAETMELLNSALVSYTRVNPDEVRVVLLEREPQLIPVTQGTLAAAVRKRLSRIGVEIRTDCVVDSVSAAGVCLVDGEVIQGKTIIGAIWARPDVISQLPGSLPNASVRVDSFLRLPDSEDIFVAGACAAFEREHPFSALRETHMGRRAAENAWSRSQGFASRPWKDRNQPVILTALGRHGSAIQIFGMAFGGLPVWFLSRFLCLFTLPGLERNLRVLIDWILDIVFRNDIVDLASHGDAIMRRGEYRTGFEIVHEGEAGKGLYLILSGEVEKIRLENGVPTTVGKLSRGDFFGQLASPDGAVEPATIRAATPLKTLFLPKEQFHL